MKTRGRREEILRPARDFRRRRGRRRLVVILAVVLIFLSLVVIFLRDERVRIRRVIVSGNESLSAAVVSQETLDLLRGAYFYLIPKDNFFFLSTGKLAGALAQAFPEIKEIAVARTFPDGLTITLGERKVEALYCHPTTEKCAYVDKTGYAFAAAPVYSEGVFLIVTMAASSAPPIGTDFAGASLFKEEDFRRLLAFRAAAEEIEGLTLVGLELGLQGLYIFRSAAGTRFLLQPGTDFTAALISLRLLFDRLGDRAAELYDVDLRLGTKLFYRFRSDVVE